MGDLISDYQKGVMKVDEFITHNHNLSGINQAFHDMHDPSGECIRAVINMREV